ncbi:rod shape-determining protein MreC [Arachidicoccus ginsenosidimutans]|uniref:rod shape-determining protein MreC n=1 Tax=Arachidicoccus sp. BS20 TaxID=1850526 RepID=UPI0007F0E01B|nr:rod shape-determining protein MreC [Arachidicoccus sp. BS20]ANI89909.1 rod shape-determining protein MreC [Arachidicoccus sp. BS20]
MKNIFLFIRRFFNFFLFLFLQVLCISFLRKYNRSYEAAYSNVAHSFTGVIDEKYNNVQYYFDLKKTNNALAAENAKLKTALNQLLHNGDSLNSNKLYTMIDSLNKDSLGSVRKYEYYEAKVVNNSVSNENNYITIEKGANQGIKKDLTVTSPTGIVGRVVSVSPNYSIVMSLLNHNSHVTVKLKRTGFNEGFVEWDGKEANVLVLNNVPKSVDVKKGDSVVTSNISDFPENLMIGRVQEIKANPSTKYYNIKIATSANFYSLQYVYVIKNNFVNEQKTLESAQPK